MTRNIVGFLVAAWLSATLSSSIRAQDVGWTSVVDPSLISEVVLEGGRLYLGTSGGLVIFNASDGSVQQFTNTIGLPSNFLTALVFDNNGDIWVGTEDAGVARLHSRAGGFEVSPLNAAFHGLADDRINTLAVWGDSVVYGTAAGAGLIVEGFAGPRFLKKDGLPSDNVNDVLPDIDRVWMATDSGVVFLDRLGFINNVSNGLPSVVAHALALTDSTVWVGTDNGAAYLRTSDETWVPDGIVNRPAFSLYFDGSTLWAGSRDRLFWNDGTGWQAKLFFEIYVKYTLNGSISEVRALQPMPDGTVYLGVGDARSERRGPNLLLFDGSSVADIPFNGPPMNSLVRLSFDVDGSLWAASRNFGVGRMLPGGQWLNFNSASGDTNLSSRFVNLTLLADSKGTKWFETLQFTPETQIALDELVDGGDLDPTNDVWKHHRLDSGGGDGLGSLRNQMAKEDPAGNRWFLSDEDRQFTTGDGRYEGINILDGDKQEWKRVNQFTTQASRSGKMEGANVGDVAFRPDGVVYVALRKSGVQEWSTGGYDKPTLFDLTDDDWVTLGTVADDFEAGDINALAVRGDGVLWVGTTQGLFKWHGMPPRWGHIEANRGFGVGLLSNDVRALVLDREENLWVGTDLGLNRIAHDDDNDIASFTTPAIWQQQLSLFFPPSAVSPIADGFIDALALHPTRDQLYIGTRGGLSILDITSLEPPETDGSNLFVYPNPIMYPQHTSLKAARVVEGQVVDVDASEVKVEIYNLEGELVFGTGDFGAGSTDSSVIWDLTTRTGVLATSGVYIVRIFDGKTAVVKTVSLLVR